MMQQYCAPALFVSSVVLAASMMVGIVNAETLLSVDFQGNKNGAYSKAEALKDFGTVDWGTGYDRGEIVESTGGDKYLRVTYPKGATGASKSGLQIKHKLKGSGRTSLWVKYRVRFGGWNGPDFTFVKGGKIPGLCGGTCPTGGKNPEGGFSARMMWRRGGEAVQYMYFEGMSGKYGEDWPWETKPGTPAVFPGMKKWITVETHVTLNSDGKSDGSVLSYWNGALALSQTGVSLRAKGEKFGIDYFYFSTFFGGSGSSWAPTNDMVADFDDIVVSTTRAGTGPTPPGPPSTTPKPLTPAPTPRRTPAPPPRPRTPAPTKSNGAAGGCSVKVTIVKVKSYYTRVEVAPMSKVSMVILTGASKTSTGAGVAMNVKMSVSYSALEARTAKMTKNRELRVVRTNGDTEVFSVVNSPRPERDDVLTCVRVIRATSNSIAQPPAPTHPPQKAVRSLAGRAKLEGKFFAGLVKSENTKLKAAVAADLSKVLKVNETTHVVSVTSITVGSLIIDFSIDSRAGVEGSAALIDEGVVQWALDEAAAEDTGRHNDSTTESTGVTTPFTSTLAMYEAQPDATDTIFMAKGLAAATPAAVSDDWADHEDGTPVSPAAPATPSPATPSGHGVGGAGANSGCRTACIAGVSAAAAIAVVALVVGAVILKSKKARAAAVAAELPIGMNDVPTPLDAEQDDLMRTANF